MNRRNFFQSITAGIWVLIWALTKRKYLPKEGDIWVGCTKTTREKRGCCTAVVSRIHFDGSCEVIFLHNIKIDDCMSRLRKSTNVEGSRNGQT